MKLQWNETTILYDHTRSCCWIIYESCVQLGVISHEPRFCIRFFRMIMHDRIRYWSMIWYDHIRICDWYYYLIFRPGCSDSLICRPELKSLSPGRKIRYQDPARFWIWSCMILKDHTKKMVRKIVVPEVLRHFLL